MDKKVKGIDEDKLRNLDILIGNAMAGKARVNIKEVVDFLVEPIVAAIGQHLQKQPEGNVFVIEVPYSPPWHDFVTQGMKLQKLETGEPLYQPWKGEQGEIPNIIDMVPLLSAVAGDPETAQQIRQGLSKIQELTQATLLQNSNIYLIVQRRESLPEAFEFFSPKQLRIRRFTPELFEKACHAFYDGLKVEKISVGASDRNWVSHVEPSDFLINTSVADDKVVSSIRQTVESRLRQIAAGLTPAPLEKFNGIEAIVGWADELKAAFNTGDETGVWRDVAHGALFQSGDALYVREIAKAMADHCGFAFVSTSIPELGQGKDVIRTMFDMAWVNAPAVLFIENFEALADTRQLIGDIARQQGLTAIRNALLRQIDAFRPAEPVVVIGSTVAHEHLDAEYQLPGRLERIFIVPEPSPQAMATLFKEALSQHSHDAISETEYAKLGQFASSLGDIRLIKLYISHAARQARSNKRNIRFGDLRDAILRGTAEGGTDRRHADRTLEQVAYHEAGHAAIGILDGDGEGANKKMPEYATVVPSPGKGGFVLRNLDNTEKLTTYKDCIKDIRLSLASRAVEEIKYGMHEISTGAGSGPGSDLHKASMTAMAMFAFYGFSANPDDPEQSGKCVFVDPGEPKDWARDPIINANARKLLEDVYLDTRQTLKAHWNLVEMIAQRLMTDDALDASELASIYRAYLASE